MLTNVSEFMLMIWMVMNVHDCIIPMHVRTVMNKDGKCDSQKKRTRGRMEKKLKQV